METNEFFRLIKDYPNVAFNAISFTEGPNKPEKGFKHLCVLEPFIGMPANWDPKIISLYETYICWNKPYMEGLISNGLVQDTKMVFVKGSVFCNHYAKIDIHPTYDERLPGIVVLNKLYNTGVADGGDILMERVKVVRELDDTSNLMVHVFSPTQWGGDCYQGPDGSPIHHSHQIQLARISHYRFVMCFESTYHPIWSQDFMTERLFNAFKAKTVPIYWGCYNIEDYVPSYLFIDMRKFSSYETLGRCLEHITEAQWLDMTESAYEWEKTSDIGSIKVFENILKGLK